MRNNPTTLIIAGSKYHKEMVTNILKKNDEYLIKDLNSKSDLSNSIIYFIGGQGPKLYKYMKLWVSKRNLLIVHWIGTDVLDFMHSYKDRKLYEQIYHRVLTIFVRYKYNNGTLIHLAVTPWLVDELETVGIKAKYFPLTSINTENLKTFTNIAQKDIDIISYVPYTKFNFYGGPEIIKLAKELPDYRFFLIHSDLDEITPNVNQNYPPNVIASPKIEFKNMQKLYSRSKLFLRLTEHDGLSLSVLEALFYKLHVFWTYPFPKTYQIKDYESLKLNIIRSIENWTPNEEGYEYVKKNYNIEKWEEQFKEIIDNIIMNRPK